MAKIASSKLSLNREIKVKKVFPFTRLSASLGQSRLSRMREETGRECLPGTVGLARLLLKFSFGPEKFPGLSRKGPRS